MRRDEREALACRHFGVRPQDVFPRLRWQVHTVDGCRVVVRYYCALCDTILTSRDVEWRVWRSEDE